MGEGGVLVGDVGEEVEVCEGVVVVGLGVVALGEVGVVVCEGWAGDCDK